MSKQNNIPAIIPLDLQQPRPLTAGLIHLYVTPVSELLRAESELLTYIKPEEDARAARFINPEHGRQHRCIRGMLRKLLGQYLNVAPNKIAFQYAEHGKPSLQDNPPLHFNLSHSRDMVAFAFSLEHELGVDIEYMRAQKDLGGMMRHVGSAREQAEWQCLDEAAAEQAFYRLWTRKEAFIKAVGRGLGMGLRSIHIGTAADTAPRPVEYKNELLADWFIQDLEPPENYKLAVCSKYINRSEYSTYG